MQKTRRDMQRRTRRNASTIGGAAPDSTIDRADADRSGLFCKRSAVIRLLPQIFHSKAEFDLKVFEHFALEQTFTTLCF